MITQAEKLAHIETILNPAQLEEMLRKDRQDLLDKAYPYIEERKLVEQRIILINKRIRELTEEDPTENRV